VSNRHGAATDVLLVNTPITRTASSMDRLGCDLNMPLGLVCLATFLNQNGVAAGILDAYAENLGVAEVVDRIAAIAPAPRIVGLNACAPNAHLALEIAAKIKRTSSGIHVACGGPHASLAPSFFLEGNDVDYVVAGEGELPLLALAYATLKGMPTELVSIPGVLTRAGTKVLGSREHPLVDLGSIPMPDFGLLPLDRYFAVKRRVYVHTSRGCAFNCIYCSVPRMWPRPPREIPMALIGDHVAELLSRHGPCEIQIVDDNFSHNSGTRIKEFCRMLGERAFNVQWKCQARADQIDAPTIAIMAGTGCFEVDLGIESGNADIQARIRKGLNLDKVKEVVALLSAAGIAPKAFFMLGFPWESYSAIADTVNFAIALKEDGLADVGFFPVMPFPGTDIAAFASTGLKQGAVIDDDAPGTPFASHRMRKYAALPEVSLNGLFTPVELRALVRLAYERFEQGRRIAMPEDELRPLRVGSGGQQ